MRRILLGLLVAVVGILGLVLAPGYLGDIDRGQIWRSEAVYMQRQGDLGYRFYGWIGPRGRWPALAIDRVDGQDGVTFTGPGDQPHRYENFPGVRMKAVTFVSPRRNWETFVLVLGKPALRPED